MKMQRFGLLSMLVTLGCGPSPDSSNPSDHVVRVSQAGGSSAQYCEGQLFISLYYGVREDTMAAICGPNAALRSHQTVSCTPAVTAHQVEQTPYPLVAPIGRDAINSQQLGGTCWRMQRTTSGVPTHYTYAVIWSREQLAVFQAGAHSRASGIRSYTDWDVGPDSPGYTFMRTDTWVHRAFILRGDASSIEDRFELSLADCAFLGQYSSALPWLCQSQNTSYWSHYSGAGSKFVYPSARFVACDDDNGWWTRARLIASPGYSRALDGPGQGYYPGFADLWTYLGLTGINRSTITFGRLNDTVLEPLNAAP